MLISNYMFIIKRHDPECKMNPIETNKLHIQNAHAPNNMEFGVSTKISSSA